MSSMDRRSFIQLALAMGATVAWGDANGLPSQTAWKERRDLFAEGVASGDPDSTSVLLWTRRSPDVEPVD
jgi:alkaline phosphatase D